MNAEQTEKQSAALARAPGSALGFLKRKPRHRWFSAPAREADNGWFGPCKTFEAAIIECAREDRHAPIFVTTGYRLTKAEREEWGAEFEWQVDAKNAVEVILPNTQVSASLDVTPCSALLAHKRAQSG